MLTVPSSPAVRSSAASTCPLSRTSAMMPSAPMACAVCVHVSGLRSQMATLAPNAASPSAMPRPMPSPPPVTTATRPVSRMLDGSMATRWRLSDLRVVHGGSGADDAALGLKVVDVLVAQPQFGQHLVVVLPEQRSGLDMDSVGPARGHERQRAVRRAGVDRMVDVFEESTDGQLRQLRLAVGLHHLG